MTIGNEGLKFEMHCLSATVNKSAVLEFEKWILKNGTWTIQKTDEKLTVLLNEANSSITIDVKCLIDGLKAVEFEEEINGASRFYAGDIIKGECDPGYIVTEHGACLRCPVGSFSNNGSATSCTKCPENKFTPPGSRSEDYCINMVYFNHLQFERNQETNTTVYDTHWDLIKDVKVNFEIDRPQPKLSSCDIIMTFEQVDLEIDIEFFTFPRGHVKRSVTATYRGVGKAIKLKDKNEYEVSIDFNEDSIEVSVSWRDNMKPKKMKFKRKSGDLASGSSKVHIAVSNSSCLNFLDDRSYLEKIPGDETWKDPTLEPPTNGTDYEEKETQTAFLCRESYYRECTELLLVLNETWSRFQVHSLIIVGIPAERGVKVTGDNNRSYVVTDMLIDANLNDGTSQQGLYLESEGGRAIVKLEFVEYQKPDDENWRRMTYNRADPDLTEYEGEEESEYVRDYDVTKEKNVEVRDLLTSNIVPFADDDEEEEDVIEELEEVTGDPSKDENDKGYVKTKVWKPDFKESKVPLKVFAAKADSYIKEDDSTSTGDLIGYFSHNGFIDVGINKNHKKKTAKQPGGRKVTSVARDTLVDTDAMTETVKAFQKFNGFPETGQLTEQESRVMSKPRCGNRDTSYKDEIESFTCIEADSEIVSDILRDHCDLDTDSFLDICSHFPNDFVASTERKREFVWRKGYYFEADLDFRKSNKKNSHVGIAFNYESSTRTSDYVFVHYEKKNNRLVFSYGTYQKGKRKVVKKISVDKRVELDSYQKRYRQFKVRLTVASDASRKASVAVNGVRIFRFETSMPTRSSVYIFTLGGKNFRKHMIKIFTSRICRRNILYEDTEEQTEEKHSRKKRWTHTNFRWYPNGGPITYAFANYSTSLGEIKTRQEVEAALKVFSSYGFRYKELSPLTASVADIVFMFLRGGAHADGFTFHGQQLEKAHAYVPVHGEIHFNDYEDFAVEKVQGEEKISLKFIAMHEIGHAMGIGHSEMENAVMAKNYPGVSAFDVDDLDEDDITALSAQYSDIVRVKPITDGTSPQKTSGLNSIDYDKIAGQVARIYEPRLPLPSTCLDRIDAAFYFYDRNTERKENLVFLMSHGYVWAFDVNSNMMQDGYPMRLASVFVGAPGEIDAAFDTGSRIFLIAGKNVYIYSVINDHIAWDSNTDLETLFGITDSRIAAAFNHRKVTCEMGSDTDCIRTTLVVDSAKYYEVVWKKFGKSVARLASGDSEKIIGKQFLSNLFGAAYEYKRSDGSDEVMIFQKVGRTARSREFFPGDAYEERTSWSDVPAAFGIVGWCVG